jgi:ABC-type branched-subunit amino acid transport system substrate-binding protein
MVAELARKGLTAAAVVGYDTGAVDFRGPIGRVAAAARSGGMDALFLPDNADRVMMIAPQLLYFGVKDVVLIGTNEWNEPRMAAKTAGYLGNAVFADAFFESGDRPEVRQFVERYRTFDDGEPNVLTAFGYDNVRLASWLIDAREARSREAVRDEMLKVQGASGVTGTITFLPSGEAEKGLTFLQVRNGRIEEIR